MDQIYMDVCEDEDFKLLLEFNDNVHMFDELIHIGGNLHYDASGTTVDGRTARIELKKRDFPVSQYQTLFIEDHKSANLFYDYFVFKDEPLYINFLHDGIAVFNLRRVTKRPEVIIGRSKTKGYGGYEYNSRNSLYVQDAAIYNNDYKLVQIPLWKQQQ